MWSLEKKKKGWIYLPGFLLSPLSSWGGFIPWERPPLSFQATPSRPSVGTQDTRSHALQYGISSKPQSDVDKAPAKRDDRQTWKWLYLRRYLGLCPSTPRKVEVEHFCCSITLVFNYLQMYSFQKTSQRLLLWSKAIKFKIITLWNALLFSDLGMSYKECWQCSRAHKSYWLFWINIDFFTVILKVALGILRLSSHSKFIKIDGFFGALDTWKSSECALWILKVLTKSASFFKQRANFCILFRVQRENCIELVAKETQSDRSKERMSFLGWFGLCIPYMCLPFSWVKISGFFPLAYFTRITMSA